MDVVWDGTTRVETLHKESAKECIALADAAKAGHWKKVLEIVTDSPKLVNCSRPGGHSFYAPLHQAAYHGATLDLVERLLRLGAFRTLRNARGERPLDVAARRGHAHLAQALQPEVRHFVPEGVLRKIEANFHSVIVGRAADLVAEHALRLPLLEPLLEQLRPEMWFPVPGMYGGFRYFLEQERPEALLVSESWSRVVGGSGQRHHITSLQAVLVEEGFV